MRVWARSGTPTHRFALSCTPRSEIKHIISNLSTACEEEEVDEIIKEADPEGTGQINYKDFAKRMFKPF